MRDFLDTLASDITSADVATGHKRATRYFSSHGFHQLRWDAAGFDDIRANRVIPIDDPAIKNNALLGPYEKQVLYHMIRSDSKLVELVGYAGSGKSSTIHHVLHHYERYRIWPPHTPNFGAGALPNSVSSSLTRLRPAFFYIDFNAICESVHIFAMTTTQRAAVLEHFQQQWAEHLSSAIIDGLRRNAQPSDGHLPLITLIDCIDLGMQWALGSEKAPHDFKFGHAFFPVNRVLRGKLRQATNPETLAHVEESLTSLRAEQRLDFWHAVIDVMQLSIAPTPPLCLVCDNADPMDVDLQRILKEQLCRALSSCHYKTLAPVRPAAYNARSFVKRMEWYPHSGPSPLDVLSLRLLNFVCAPDGYGPYQGLQPLDKHRSVCAALELLLRLRRGHGQFRTLGTILHCAAGDSIRRMLEIGHALLTSERLSASFEVPISSGVIEAVRKRYELGAYLERVATALADELIAISHEEELNNGESIARFTERLAHRAMLTITAVTKNSMQIDNGSLRKLKVGQLEKALANSDAGGHSASLIREACLEAIETSARRGMRKDRAQAVLAEIADWIEHNGTQLLMREWEDHGTCSQLLKFLTSAVRGEVVVPRSPPQEESEDFFWQDPACRQLLAANKNYAYNETALYLSHIENLFRIAGRESGHKLFVLYSLALGERRQYTTDSLIKELRQRSCDDATILDLVNELIAPMQRLMWMDRAFKYPDFAALMESANNPVELSRAGFSYYTTLLGLSHYALCCLAPTVASAGEAPMSLPLRAAQVLQSLRAMSVSEQPFWATARGGSGALRSFCAFDVAARVATDMAVTLRRYFARRRTASDARNALQACRQVVYDWRQFLVSEARAIESASQIDILRLPRPDLRIAPGSVDPRRRARTSTWTVEQAVTELESHLSSDKLWRDDLVPDEFSPEVASALLRPMRADTARVAGESSEQR